MLRGRKKIQIVTLSTSALVFFLTLCCSIARAKGCWIGIQHVIKNNSPIFFLLYLLPLVTLFISSAELFGKFVETEYLYLAIGISGIILSFVAILSGCASLKAWHGKQVGPSFAGTLMTVYYIWLILVPFVHRKL